MNIAVVYENGNVFQHFGKAQNIKIYNVKEKDVLETKVISTNGEGHGAICNVLLENKVEVLICGGLGQGAKDMLEENNIQIYPGVIGNADKKVKEFLDGVLKYDSEYKCTHHNHHEHDCESHDCASEKGGCKGNK